MRILANENLPAAAVIALREAGHDVTWVREESPGESDTAILDRAQREERILLTFDKDFGELAFRLRLPSLQGIILLRISAPSPEHVATKSVEAISTRTDWHSHFSVIEDNRIRMTRLPRNR